MALLKYLYMILYSYLVSSKCGKKLIQPTLIWCHRNFRQRIFPLAAQPLNDGCSTRIYPDEPKGLAWLEGCLVSSSCTKFWSIFKAFVAVMLKTYTTFATVKTLVYVRSWPLTFDTGFILIFYGRRVILGEFQDAKCN